MCTDLTRLLPLSLMSFDLIRVKQNLNLLSKLRKNCGHVFRIIGKTVYVLRGVLVFSKNIIALGLGLVSLLLLLLFNR